MTRWTSSRLYRPRRSALLAVFAVMSAPAALDAEIAEAIAYLATEVPRWKTANNCWSCHNNGDGARALFAAHAEAAALENTIELLRQPDLWGEKTIEKIQFGATLEVAIASGYLKHGAGLLHRAAEEISRRQEPDGRWKVDEETNPGSPVTYGPALATALAVRVLRASGSFGKSADRGEEWLRNRRGDHTLDVGSALLIFASYSLSKHLLKTQAANGSWNGEPFDTAVAMLALGADLRRSRNEQTNSALRRAPDEQTNSALRRAREFLLKTQLVPGGWPATTRPAGGDSYAQHISTTAWALQALVESKAVLSRP